MIHAQNEKTVVLVHPVSGATVTARFDPKEPPRYSTRGPNVFITFPLQILP